MESDNTIEIINRIFLALMDDQGGFIQSQLDFLKKHPKLKEYEIWKARNNLSQHTLEVINMYHLKQDVHDVYREPTLRLFQKVAQFTKTDEAKKLLTLQYLSTDLNALNFKYLDNLLQEYMIWQETGSVKDLYNLTEVYRGDNYGLYTADMYNNVLFYIKANGEKIDGTNKDAISNPWCIAEDEGFDLNKKFETLVDSVLTKINREYATSGTFTIQDYTPEQKVFLKIWELKAIEDKLNTVANLLNGFTLENIKNALQEKLNAMYKLSTDMGITEKVKERLDQILKAKK